MKKYSFLLENLVFGIVFFWQNGLFYWKKRIFYKFFSRKTEVSTLQYYFIWKYSFLLENLVFGVKTCIFLTKQCFPLEKNGFSRSFSLGKLRFPLWNTIFDESALFYLKTLFSLLKLVFFWQNGLFHWKKRFSLSFSIGTLTFPL